MERSIGLCPNRQSYSRKNLADPVASIMPQTAGRAIRLAAGKSVTSVVQQLLSIGSSFFLRPTNPIRTL